jgi:hypothetical protein
MPHSSYSRWFDHATNFQKLFKCLIYIYISPRSSNLFFFPPPPPRTVCYTNLTICILVPDVSNFYLKRATIYPNSGYSGNVDFYQINTWRVHRNNRRTPPSESLPNTTHIHFLISFDGRPTYALLRIFRHLSGNYIYHLQRHQKTLPSVYTACLFSTWFSHKIPIIFISSLNRLFYIMYMDCVFCEVWNETVCVVKTILSLQRVKWHDNVSWYFGTICILTPVNKFCIHNPKDGYSSGNVFIRLILLSCSENRPT